MERMVVVDSAISSFDVDKLKVEVYPDRRVAGKRAASVVSDRIVKLLGGQEEVRMIFAAGPSQNEFLEELSGAGGVNWSGVVAFHMDEYVGLKNDAKELWGTFMKERLFGKLNFKATHYLNPEPGDPEQECERYAGLIKEAPIDIVCMGIGENGHIAFNDPAVADFNDPRIVKIVDLDEICRQQQVHDGCFASVDRVPRQAMTVTIPAMMSARFLSIVVPGPTKSGAVRDSLKGEISTRCPASVLRRHDEAVMFLDVRSAAEVI